MRGNRLCDGDMLVDWDDGKHQTIEATYSASTLLQSEGEVGLRVIVDLSASFAKRSSHFNLLAPKWRVRVEGSGR